MILITLIAGIFLGYSGLMKGFFDRYLEKIITLGLIILLFCMGVKIGLNKQILQNLSYLSLKAILISLSAIAFSVLSIRILAAKLLILEKEETH